MEFSQTQLANISTTVGLLILIANQFGIILEQQQTTFIIGAVWSVLSVIYNWYQRYQKGDLNLLGSRK